MPVVLASAVVAQAAAVQLNGFLAVIKTKPEPGLTPVTQAIDRTQDHAHKFTIKRSNFRVCEVCSLSDVYVRSKCERALETKQGPPVCDHCGQAVEEWRAGNRWQHTHSHMIYCGIRGERDTRTTVKGSLYVDGLVKEAA